MRLALINSQKDRVLITILFLWLASAVIRIIAVSDYNFPYWFDSGRDAVLSREIIEKRDIKIQGPSASGTNDTVFHGVLYYYIIGPLYTVFAGDPQRVLYVIIAFSSLGVIPFYLLVLRLTKNQHVANMSGLFYVFSYEVFKGVSWFSNPVIASFSLSLFFYLYWLVFFEEKRKLLPYLLVALAITNQAGILYAPWLGLIILGFIFEYQRGNLGNWRKSTIVLSCLAYALGISSMVLTQLKLWLSGIFSLTSLSSLSVRTFDNPAFPVQMVWNQFFSKILNSITPNLPVMSLLIFGGIIYFANKKINNRIKCFLIIIFTSPLLLLSWHYRLAYHTLLTIELSIYVLMALFILELWKKRIGKIIAGLIVLLFLTSNLSEYLLASRNKAAEYFVPQGAYLRDLLNTIDYSYAEARGNEFSISTITNPYGYNTLWAYLYSWYGLKKYGYLPDWYGPNQEGIFGGDLLRRTTTPKATHFGIREPRNGIPDYMFTWFEIEQNNVASQSAVNKFGTVEIVKYGVR